MVNFNVLTHDAERQHALRQNFTGVQGNDKSVRNKHRDGLRGDLLPVEQHNDDQNVVLDDQNHVLKVVHQPVAVGEVVERRHRVADDFDRQRLQRNSLRTFLLVNRRDLREF